jgi:hypothetical protein
MKGAVGAVLALLLAAASTAAEGGSQAVAQGAIVYVHRTVMAGPGDVRLGDIVRAGTPRTPAATETLARSVAVIADRILYLPASLSTGLIEQAFGSDCIIVGARTLVIPRDAVPDAEAYVLDRLADFLDAQGLVPEGKVEITLAQNLVRGEVPRQGAPVFQVVPGARGATEVTFSLSSASGGSVSGRVSLPAASAPGGAATAAERISAGTGVEVTFHKGPVTIEMPGRALAAARVGERVPVSVAESQKRFTGTLREGKAVDVDLP